MIRTKGEGGEKEREATEEDGEGGERGRRYGDKSDGSMGGKREVRMIERKRMEHWRMIRQKKGS